MTLTEILYGTFVPPTKTKTRVHRIDGKTSARIPMRIITEQLNSDNKREQASGEAKLRIYKAMKGMGFLSTKRIGQLAKSDNRTVEKALAEMKKAGLLKTKKIPRGYVGHYTYWKICEQ
jgi:Fic family protein